MDYSIRSTTTLSPVAAAAAAGHKVKILDYFTMDVLNEDGVTYASSDGKLRGNCNICGKSYGGTVRVKSNFITHLRKNHPLQYNEFRLACGKHDTVPVVGLDALNDDDTPATNGLLSAIDYRHAVVTTSAPYMASMATPLPSMVPHVNRIVPMAGNVNNARVMVKPERQPNSVHQQKKRELLYSMADLIVVDMLPQTLLSSPRFQRLMSIAGVSELPSINDVNAHISSSAESLQDTIREELLVPTHLWITVQCWTQATDCHLITIDAHYLSNWIIHHRTIYSHDIDTCDLGENSGLIRYGLDTMDTLNKVYGIVTGLNTITNLPSEMKLMAMTDNQVKSERGIIDSKLPGAKLYSLEARLGELVCDALLTSSDHMIPVICKAIKLLKLMLLPQIDANMEPWYKQLEHLTKVIDMDAATKAALIEIAEPEKLLTESELGKLTQLLATLTPFKDVAVRISKVGEISSSLVIPSIKVLQASLEEMKSSQQASQCQALVNTLSDKLPEYLEEHFVQSKALQLSTILDPRFKVQWCGEQDRDHMKSMLVKEVQRIELIGSHESPLTAMPHMTSPTSGSATGSGFFSKILQQKPTSNHDGGKSVEVYRYLDEPILGEDSNPLTYWKAMEEKLPHVAKLAGIYLSLPMSSNSICDLYNHDEQVYHMRTTSLQDDCLENVALLRAHKASKQTHTAINNVKLPQLRHTPFEPRL